VAPIVVGALAVSAFAAGGGVLGWVSSDYGHLAGTCGSSCPRASWSDLPGRADAGYALLAIGGALAVTDVVLWVLDVRAGRRARSGTHASAPSSIARAFAGGAVLAW
jgi:hypothetical protein